MRHDTDFFKIYIQLRKNLEVIRIKNTEVFQIFISGMQKSVHVLIKTNYGFNVEKNLIIAYNNNTFKSSFTIKIKQIVQLMLK